MDRRSTLTAPTFVATLLVALAKTSSADAQASSPPPQSSNASASTGATREPERAMITAVSTGAPFDVSFEPTHTGLDSQSSGESICRAPCVRYLSPGRYEMTVTSRRSLRMTEPIEVAPGQRLYLWIRPPSNPTGGIALVVVGAVFTTAIVPLAIATADLAASTGFLSELSHEMALVCGIGAAVSGILGIAFLGAGIGSLRSARGEIEHRGASPHPHVDLSLGVVPGAASARLSFAF